MTGNRSDVCRSGRLLALMVTRRCHWRQYRRAIREIDPSRLGGLTHLLRYGHCRWLLHHLLRTCGVGLRVQRSLRRAVKRRSAPWRAFSRLGAVSRAPSCLEAFTRSSFRPCGHRQSDRDVLQGLSGRRGATMVAWPSGSRPGSSLRLLGIVAVPSGSSVTWGSDHELLRPILPWPCALFIGWIVIARPFQGRVHHYARSFRVPHDRSPVARSTALVRARRIGAGSLQIFHTGDPPAGSAGDPDWHPDRGLSVVLRHRLLGFHRAEPGSLPDQHWRTLPVPHNARRGHRSWALCYTATRFASPRAPRLRWHRRHEPGSLISRCIVTKPRA